MFGGRGVIIPDGLRTATADGFTPTATGTGILIIRGDGVPTTTEDGCIPISTAGCGFPEGTGLRHGLTGATPILTSDGIRVTRGSIEHSTTTGITKDITTTGYLSTGTKCSTRK